MSDKLDNVLQDWAAKKASTEEHLKDLASHITNEAVRRRYDGTPGVSIPFWSKLAHAGLGAAVALVVSFFCLRLLVPTTLQPADNGAAANLASVTREQIQAGRRLFTETERLFSDRLRWVSESNGDVGLGVETITGGITEDSSPMFVRLTVVSRKAGETIWRPMWNTDVLLRGEEMVEVVPNRKEDNKLVLWVYPLADGKVAVDTSLSLDMPVQLASSINGVVEQGKPLEIISLRTEEVEYRVFQTVKIL